MFKVGTRRQYRDDYPDGRTRRPIRRHRAQVVERRGLESRNCLQMCLGHTRDVLLDQRGDHVFSWERSVPFENIEKSNVLKGWTCNNKILLSFSNVPSHIVSCVNIWHQLACEIPDGFHTTCASQVTWIFHRHWCEKLTKSVSSNRWNWRGIKYWNFTLTKE